MVAKILMPALSPTMEEGTLQRWLKQVGDPIESGEPVAEIETDKATMEVEAVEEGTLGRILVEGGTDHVAVNTPIALVLEEGDSEADLDKGEGASAQAPPEEEAAGGSDAIESAPADMPAPARPAPAEPASEGESEPEPEYSGETVEQTVREALRDGLAEEMRREDRVFMMGEEIAEYEGAYKVTQGLLAEFGARRVIDTPITEHGFAGLGVGAAFYGLFPVVEFMTWNFAMQAMDHIINSAAKTLYMAGGKMGCPIVFRGPNGAASRVAAQHSQDYTSWYGHVPGLKVVSPYSAADAKGLLKAAIRDPNPVIFLENEILYGHSFEVPTDPDFTLPIGKAKVVRSGSDVTLVGYSLQTHKALAAAETLSAEHGIEAEVIDLRSIRPLDTATVVASVKKTNRLVTIEENWPAFGLGAEMAAQMMARAFDYLDAPPLRVHQADVPLPYAANLEALALPQPADVVEAAKSACYVS